MTDNDNVKTTWDLVMDETQNPLKNYSLPTAHMLMQMLAWMWSAIFSLSIGSYLAFGISAVTHMLFIGGLFMTIIVFNKAELNATDQ
ncbi:hypothetical protein ROA7450_02956 [Roseovarius albus]|uniref:Uncharacterized protein n=1 Tax=Roseovarius albus TaxID=1247867 RepID=A0A1X6ZNQ6_9RHOB|nr:hypothetical protein [Roseovarius albus]SLN56973.1 hypothetical protein ROA7450_02956 [Roseovarius albus]